MKHFKLIAFLSLTAVMLFSIAINVHGAMPTSETDPIDDVKVFSVDEMSNPAQLLLGFDSLPSTSSYPYCDLVSFLSEVDGGNYTLTIGYKSLSGISGAFIMGEIIANDSSTSGMTIEWSIDAGIIDASFYNETQLFEFSGTPEYYLEASIVSNTIVMSIPAEDWDKDWTIIFALSMIEISATEFGIDLMPDDALIALLGMMLGGAFSFAIDYQPLLDAIVPAVVLIIIGLAVMIILRFLWRKNKFEDLGFPKERAKSIRWTAFGWMLGVIAITILAVFSLFYPSILSWYYQLFVNIDITGNVGSEGFSLAVGMTLEGTFLILIGIDIMLVLIGEGLARNKAIEWIGILAIFISGFISGMLSIFGIGLIVISSFGFGVYNAAISSGRLTLPI